MRKIGTGLAIVALALAGSITYVTIESWRPVMPEVAVAVRAAVPMSGATLMLIYGENGSDPMREGPLAVDQRIASCRISGSLCVSKAARKEIGAIGARAQSLQVRLFNGKGNPVVGALRWSGPFHPERISIACDLRVAETQTSCAVTEVTA